MTILKIGVISIVLIIISGLGFILSGVYPMGADVPHNRFTYWALETMRERSISRSANRIIVPTDLNDSDRLLQGGADYNDMCASCHLRPGITQSDFSIGLYPKPLNLSMSGGKYSTDETKLAARQFWIIKHGIKASGMPTWGPTHGDDRIWSMVAFVQQLPKLNADQYQILTTREDGDEHH